MKRERSKQWLRVSTTCLSLTTGTLISSTSIRMGAKSDSNQSRTTCLMCCLSRSTTSHQKPKLLKSAKAHLVSIRRKPSHNHRMPTQWTFKQMSKMMISQTNLNWSQQLSSISALLMSSMHLSHHQRSLIQPQLRRRLSRDTSVTWLKPILNTSSTLSPSERKQSRRKSRLIDSTERLKRPWSTALASMVMSLSMTLRTSRSLSHPTNPYSNRIEQHFLMFITDNYREKLHIDL